jgi:protein-S-isoprenylcysteine O-methyltransferase Ste14
LNEPAKENEIVKTPLRHAGVHVPPPLFYIAGLVAGEGLDRWRPLPISRDAAWLREGVGLFGILVWLAVFLSAYITFRRARTTIIPNRPATTVVTHGPYRFTRNPMYVSLVAFYLGAMFLMNTWWPLLFLPVVVAVIDRAIIAREERYLSSAFPE